METLQSIRQLEGLRDEWNALADGRGHALLRHEWILSAAATLHDAGQIAVAIRRRGTDLDAAAPLVRTRAGGLERLELAGARTLHEPTGVLARDADARRHLVEGMFRLRLPLLLQRLSADEDAPVLQRAARGRGVLLLKPTPPSLGVPLGGARAVRPDDLPSKLRHDLKRARTRAAERGEVTVDVDAPAPREVDAALDAFMRVESSGWKGRRRSALAVNARLEAFFRMYGRLAAEAGTLRVFFLRVKDAIVAAQIAAEVYERLWVLKIGYDEAMARCSPGFLLTAEAIGYAARRGLQSYEFLGGAEAWEERWRPERRPCTLAVFYPWTVTGGVSASIDVAGATWRRLRSVATHAH